MLLTTYSESTSWYVPFVDEIFTGITIEDIAIDESSLLEHNGNIVLKFCVELCKSIYNKLLETNNARDIHIYLVALRIASYEPNIILSSLMKKKSTYFEDQPIIFLLLFSEENIFKYQELRHIYESWHE